MAVLSLNLDPILRAEAGAKIPGIALPFDSSAAALNSGVPGKKRPLSALALAEP